jgi:glycosyltransferase involved in cell wall biosynthesis
MPQKTAVISINASWNVINFRMGLVKGLQGAGYRVVALTPTDAYSGRFAALGIEHVPIPIDSQGASPAKDFGLLLRYLAALRRLRPAVYMGYTAKPNVYGSLAAHALGIPVINNVSGLGTAFIRKGLLTSVVSGLYRLAFRRSSTVFFQNPEDLNLFVGAGLVEGGKAALLPGSGVDLSRFVPGAAARGSDGPFTFLLVARLLWDKGVGEYVEAARRVRERHSNVRFQLLGFLDVANRTAVPRSQVEHWVAEGLIDYLGHADDVRPYLAAADCVVLPSYREGLPRTLLEAAAMGKPLIATDVPGCRHVAEDGVNGYLCTARDSASLAKAMSRMLTLSDAERRALGAAARAKVEAEFDERRVVERYLQAVERAIALS